jgi:hypothetical protein
MVSSGLCREGDSLPLESDTESSALQRLHLLQRLVITDKHHRDLLHQPQTSASKDVLTLVFLIRTFNAPTPPLSPADIPSTSSMIKHVRVPIFISATVVL